MRRRYRYGAQAVAVFVAWTSVVGSAVAGETVQDALGRNTTSSGEATLVYTEGVEGHILYQKFPDGRLIKVDEPPGGETQALGAAVGTGGLAGRSVTTGATVAAARSGRFLPYETIPVGSWPEVVAIGDLNNDGREDVALATSFYFDPENDHHLHVFLQDQQGKLAFAYKLPTGQRPRAIAMGDVDHDGLTDVAVANADGTVGIFAQDGSGRLDPMVSYPVGTGPDGVSIADLNGDGLSDVVVSHWNSEFISLLLQNPTGTLDAAVNYGAQNGGYDEIGTSDVNRDGDADVVLMSGQGLDPDLSVFLQNRTEGIVKNPIPYVVTNRNTHGFAVGDFNHDGRQDVVVSSGGNRGSSFDPPLIHVLLQRADGTLDAPVQFAAFDIPESVVVADVNGDERDDVLVAHGGWVSLSVYLNAADDRLLNPYELYPIPYASHYQPQGLAVGDINLDGSPDVAIADYNSGLVLLRNVLDRAIHVDRYALSRVAPDGSALHPFRSLTEAIAVAHTRAHGAVIQVKRGRYRESLELLRPGVKIFGSYAQFPRSPSEPGSLRPGPRPTTEIILKHDRPLILQGDNAFYNCEVRGSVRVE